jgi:hypothetical protein
LLHCDEWDRVVALPRHKFVTGATLLQLHSRYIIGISIFIAKNTGFVVLHVNLGTLVPLEIEIYHSFIQSLGKKKSHPFIYAKYYSAIGDPFIYWTNI